MDKICPLLTAGLLANPETVSCPEPILVNCKGKDCQFWVDRSGTHKESGTEWNWTGCGLVAPKGD